MIGALVEIGSVLFLVGGLGDFECSGSSCDSVGPWPFLLGGGIVLFIIGFFVISFAASAFALRGGAATVERWSRLARMNRVGTFGSQHTSHTAHFSGPGPGRGDGTTTSWQVTSSSDLDAIPQDLQPMVEGISAACGQAASSRQTSTDPAATDPAATDPR